jgi:ATP-dependent Lon protease
MSEAQGPSEAANTADTASQEPGGELTVDVPTSEHLSWTLPVLPMKNTVLFPFMFLPLAAGRSASVAAVEAALASEEKAFVVVAQKDGSVEEPTADDLFTVGTRVVIKKMARTPERFELLVQGLERVRVVEFKQQQPYLLAHVEVMPLPEDGGPEVDALYREVLDLARRAFELAQPESPVQVEQLLAQADDPLRLAYMLGSMLSIEVSREQALLEANTRAEVLRLLHDAMSHEVKVLELRQKIGSKAQSELSKEQRDYILRQQLRAIQDELGEQSPEKAEIAALRQQLEEADLPDEIRKETERELTRLERLPPAAPDHQLIRTYIEFVLELPWRKTTKDSLDLDHARQVLDEDHFGLDEIKARILEHLAVLKLNPEAKAPILCFVGPPGVGKTSLGQSIARAMGRQFERTSLGGMHDEAELRGHRRTYIGAMPGRILQAIRRAEVNNPVLMLDEVDKLGRDYRGDPAAALLEILDPAQNFAFRDNFLDQPFDLSRVFFITTANTLDTIPRPLLDRMEILRLSGYTAEEKQEIARRYLIPRQIKQTGLTPEQLTIPDETVKQIVTRYTRESGVRQLEQTLGRLARKVAVRFAKGETNSVTVRPEDLPELLGPERFFQEQARKELPPGVVTGLAWTETGGEVLYVEASLLPGTRGLRLTGQLGKVMKESARAALSYVWSHAGELGIDPVRFRNNGVHVHVPAGSVPKDGPSAGTAMTTALTSLFTDKPVRNDTAMTGEITLTGLVLPIGGVKEKVIAARAAGIKQVILPRANEKDLRDLPETVRQELTFVFAERIAEVLAAAIPEVRTS